MGTDTRSPAQIEKDIDHTRVRLASTIDELAYRVQPATILQRQLDVARRSLYSATHTPEGDIRYEVVAPVAAAVVGLVALAVWRRVR